MSEEYDSDNSAFLIGGFLGALLASPTKQDKIDLAAYREFKKLIESRKKKLGELPSLEKLKLNTTVYHMVVETTQLYLYGFFRASSIWSSATIEYTLRQAYKNKKLRFVDLIEKARDDKMISKSDYHFFQGVRLDRNDIIHESEKPDEEDSILYFKIMTRVITRAIQHQYDKPK